MKFYKGELRNSHSANNTGYQRTKSAKPSNHNTVLRLISLIFCLTDLFYLLIVAVKGDC
jgi:hypothetical protein